MAGFFVKINKKGEIVDRMPARRGRPPLGWVPESRLHSSGKPKRRGRKKKKKGGAKSKSPKQIEIKPVNHNKPMSLADLSTIMNTMKKELGPYVEWDKSRSRPKEYPLVCASLADHLGRTPDSIHAHCEHALSKAPDEEIDKDGKHKLKDNYVLAYMNAKVCAFLVGFIPRSLMPKKLWYAYAD